MKRSLLLLLFVAFLAGCASKIDHVVYTANAGSSPMLWEQEVVKRYPDAVVVFCHGFEEPELPLLESIARDGVWRALPDSGQPVPVESIVAQVRQKFPARKIVLLICNPQGERLPAGCTNVAYALRNVWTVPDSASGIDLDARFSVDYAGSIFDFVEQ